MVLNMFAQCILGNILVSRDLCHVSKKFFSYLALIPFGYYQIALFGRALDPSFSSSYTVVVAYYAPLSCLCFRSPASQPLRRPRLAAP
jgi:hypothetical protein